MTPPAVAIFGASGLIGELLCAALIEADVNVVAVARRFTKAQRSRLAQSCCELDFMALEHGQLAALLVERHVDVVINCVGVLQDGPKGSTQAVHVGWMEKLLGAMGGHGLLIQLSMPGEVAFDHTSFSRSKHEADAMIAARAKEFVILRPGFVLAQTAYGGSALLRALASLPVKMSRDMAAAEFRVTHADDIAATVVDVLDKWRGGQRGWRASFDVMSREVTTVADVIRQLSERFGGPSWRAPLPAWLMRLGARAGDVAATLGWMPPIRSTSLAEMQRGVTGDPQSWIEATGIRPAALATVLRRLPVGVQERWFGRLYLLKAVVLATLSLFWIASGVIALTVAFAGASALLVKAGLPDALARATAAVTAILDIAIGAGIAVRGTARASLWAGVAVSLGYLAGSVVLLPELWADPVGAMVKTVPAVVLMLVAIATMDDR
jgi:nucleoside-diphosphate-sugar epimerase